MVTSLNVGNPDLSLLLGGKSTDYRNGEQSRVGLKWVRSAGAER